MDFNLKAVTRQLGLGKTVDDRLQASLLGQAYVADWKYLLTAAGRAFTVSIPEHATGGGDLTLATGNATGDLDQPEIIVTVDAGHCLIPLSFDISIQDDADAYDDEVEVYLFGDLTQAVSSATATLLTPKNHLDDGPAFPGRAWSTATSDITDPVHSTILGFRNWELTQVAAETAGSAIGPMVYQKEWNTPRVLRGPCTIIGLVVGTVAPDYMCTLELGVVPSDWFPTT